MDPSGSSSLKFGLISSLGLFLVKGAIGLSCGSAAVSASALFSLSNTVTHGFSLLGMKMASRPADEEHPFGYGKEMFFWSFIAAVFMFGVASMGAISKGLQQINERVTVSFELLPVLAIMTSLAFECIILKSILSRDAYKNFSCVGSSLKASLRLFNGNVNPISKLMLSQGAIVVVSTSLSLVAMLSASWTGKSLADGITSIAIGLLLAGTAVVFAFRLKDLIIGCSACSDTVQQIKDLTMKVPGVAGISKIKTMLMGPNSLLVNMEIQVNKSLNVESTEEITEAIESMIKSNLRIVKHINIEACAKDTDQEQMRKTKLTIGSEAMSKVM